MIKNYIFGSTYETICVLSAQLPLVNYILLLIAVDCVSGRVLRKENMFTDNILNFFKMWFLNFCSFLDFVFLSAILHCFFNVVSQVVRSFALPLCKKNCTI